MMAFHQFPGSVPIPKAFRQGTHRVVSPQETLARVKPMLAKAGITRIADVTGLDRIGVPVVMVCRPNSRSLAVSQGKGLTLEAARASGVMESLELHHAENILLPLKLSTYEQLRSGHRVVKVTKLPSIKNSLFHPHLQILWIEGQDLFDGLSTWLPFECVHTSASSPYPAGSGCFSITSNGLASGNHKLEAMVHGICEVVERDAVALWNARSREKRARTLLDLASIDDPNCQQVVQCCESAGNIVAVWDITSDIGLPAFMCRIAEREYESLYAVRFFCGMGCHTTREIGLLRALTEAVQSRLTYISGSRDDLFRYEYATAPDPEAAALHAEMFAQPGVALRKFRDVPNFDTETFDDDLAILLAHLRAVGIDSVITVDLTRPEFGIAVVRVVIPGLEGPDAEPVYVPGARARAVREQS